MNPTDPTNRPEYISPDWLRCTVGMAFSSSPPEWLRSDAALSSSNDWERLVCVTLQAQAGNFRNVKALLPIIERNADDHLRDCAVRVFALSAPSTALGQLATVFRHPDDDTRLEAYAAASLTGDLALALALASHRARTHGYERDRVMDSISDMVEPQRENLEIAENTLPDEAFTQRIRGLVAELRARHGQETFIYYGEPMDIAKIAEAIAHLCRAEDPEQNGGVIAKLFCLLEGMTGISYVGCLDDDCTPILPRIASTLNKLRMAPGLARTEPGSRYFFGHRLA